MQLEKEEGSFGRSMGRHVGAGRSGGEIMVARQMPVWPPPFHEGRRLAPDAVSSYSCEKSRRIVCVTSGNSLLGLRIVEELLARGYLVRVMVHSQEELEEFEGREDYRSVESVVIANMGDLGSLCEAFRGCHTIFHTSSFVDPKGISGYSERMATVEAAGSANVIEACKWATSSKRCILTSSLLASIWPTNSVSPVLDESCWSDEDFCRANKLWLALGKTMMEKVAWRKSEEMPQVNLVTVCHGLLMDPVAPAAHQSASIAYLKGGWTMYQRGVLATVDVNKVAKAHVRIYEEMEGGACGRYLCFDRVIREEEEVIGLEHRLKIHGLFLRGRNLPQQETDAVESNCLLSNSKLTRLVSCGTNRRCNGN